MKKILLVTAACCLLFSACKKNETVETVPDPVFALVSDSEVTVGFEGGEVCVLYSLDNCAENGDVSATAPGADWCTDFNTADDGKVTFTVAPNDAEERTCDVILTYTYGQGETQNVSVTITQAALGEPVISITSGASVSVGSDRNEVVVTYTVDYPFDDGTMSAAAPEADWCSGFDCSVDGKVTFDVAANDGDERTAEIVLTFTYGDDQEVKASVTLIQEGLPAPVLTITSGTEITVSGAGETVTVSYSIEGEREDGVIAVVAPDWCTDIDCSVDGEVKITVAANDGDERSAEAILSYTYGEGKEVTASVTITQGVFYNYEFSAPNVFGNYYGDDFSTNAGDMVYNIWLTDADNTNEWVPGATYYVLSLVSTEPSNMNAIAPAPGTYNMSMSAGQDVMGQWTIWKDMNYTYGCIIGDGGYAQSRYIFSYGQAEVTVTDGIYTIDAVLTDTRNETHHITYKGTILLDDARKPDIPEESLSNLTEDIDVSPEWMNVVADGIFWGSTNIPGVNEYSITFKNPDNGNADTRTFQLTIYMPESNTIEEGILPGSYPINATGEANTVRAGYLNDGSTTLRGSWFHDRANVYPNTTAAPLADGTVIVTKTSDGKYMFVLDAKDDAAQPHSIKGVFMVDYTPYDASGM